jgi:RNA polymerase sigma factor (sigma-70 family)
MAFRLARNGADAADLFQDTIEHALRARRNDIGPSSALPWLVTIMKHAFIDGCRQQKTRQAVLARVERPEPCAEDGEGRPARWRYVDDELLASSIAALPPRAGEMVRLSLNGARYAELSARFAIPEATVGTRLHRIRRRLRGRLRAALENVADEAVQA